jgi:hypothetical protein
MKYHKLSAMCLPFKNNEIYLEAILLLVLAATDMRGELVAAEVVVDCPRRLGKMEDCLLVRASKSAKFSNKKVKITKCFSRSAKFFK